MADRGPTTAEATVWRVDATACVVAPDVVAVESPLELRVEGRPVAVAMRTPGHDDELAVGFLVSESVVRRRTDLFEITTCPSQADGGRVVDVLLARPEEVDFQSLTRHVFSASSCGICGKAAAEAIFHHFPPLPAVSEAWVDPGVVFVLPERLRQAQAAFARTGGLHASALFSAGGDLRLLREDVGRHNALDKVLGASVLADNWPLDHSILVLSGRVSFELMQKSLAARIPVVVAISAPSSLAVEFAQASGQTLCGFVRDGRMNVYSHPERLRLPVARVDEAPDRPDPSGGTTAPAGGR